MSRDMNADCTHWLSVRCPVCRARPGAECVDSDWCPGSELMHVGRALKANAARADAERRARRQMRNIWRRDYGCMRARLNGRQSHYGPVPFVSPEFHESARLCARLSTSYAQQEVDDASLFPIPISIWRRRDLALRAIGCDLPRSAYRDLRGPRAGKVLP